MDDALNIPGMRPSGCSVHALRRLLAGELAADAAEKLEAHVAACARCQARRDALKHEQASLHAELPFDAFAERVLESAAASARPAQQRRRRLQAVSGALALAACALLFVSVGPKDPAHRNGAKGGSGVELFVGGTGASPRLAQDGETLAPGERVRVGYHALDKRYVAVLSVDEQGDVSALYPEDGASLPAEPGAGTHLLPESVEFTGGGAERVFAVFSDSPLEMEALKAAARRELARAGGVTDMGPLSLDATGVEQSTQLLHKR